MHHYFTPQVRLASSSCLDVLHRSNAACNPIRRDRGKHGLLADPVYQPVGPEMGDLRLHRRDRPEDGACNREADTLKQVSQMPPGAVREARVRYTGTRHIIRSRIQADSMPAVVEEDGQIHPGKGEAAKETREPEGPSQRRVDEIVRRVDSVEGGKQQHNRQMAREKVGLPEQMHQKEMP